jgi:hypothetical protein
MSPMPAPTTFPPLKVLRDMLLDLLDRGVEVAPADPWSPTMSDPGAVAVYVDDSSRLRGLICCDLSLSVALSASIALIPARTAASCLEEGQLTDDMIENLNEVFNILAAFLNMGNLPHVRLYALHAPGELPPADLCAPSAGGKTSRSTSPDTAAALCPSSSSERGSTAQPGPVATRGAAGPIISCWAASRSPGRVGTSRPYDGR